MKNLLIAVAVATLLFGPTAARAQEKMGGLGFRTLSGPEIVLPNSGIAFSASPAIGIRQWFNAKTALDLAVGFTSLSAEAGPPTTKLDEGTGYVIDLGVAFAAKKWDKVSFIVRPGFQYGQAKATDKLSPLPPNEIKATTMSVSGEFEVEYMLAEKLSISAAHGIAYRSVKFRDNDTPESEFNITGFETAGNNFTQLGFIVYLW